MSDAPPPLSQDDPDAGGAASERPTPPREPLFNALPGVVLVLAAIKLMEILGYRAGRQRLIDSYPRRRQLRG